MLQKQNIQEENSKSEEINETVSQEQTIESTSNQQTENMEVHHHPDLHHRKKHWKEYFLEFLMIFLAVTLGFFAESLRENIVNHEKEKHYIEGMFADLKKDTSNIYRSISFQQSLLNKMDNSLKIPVEKIRDIPTQDTFYRNFVYFYAWVTSFTQNDNTFTQLKNAGGFSVIHKENIIDSISLLNIFYESAVKLNEGWYVKAYEKMADLATQLIRLPVTPVTIDDTIFAVIPGNTEVFTRYDKPLLEQLYTLIRYEKGCLLVYIEAEKEYRKKTVALIEFLQKEYNLQ